MATNLELFWPFPPSQIGTPIWGYPGHQGTDWPKPTGTPVPATSNGTIVFAGDDGLGGNTIDLQRDDGLIQRFGHLSAIWVKVGQRVNAGNTIGLVGSTGNSTGPHLHWELRWDRLWNGGRVVNPGTMHPQIFGTPPSQEEDDMTPEQAKMLTDLHSAVFGDDKKPRGILGALYDGMFKRGKTSQGYAAGLLPMTNSIRDAQFKETETTLGTPGGTLVNDRVILEQLALIMDRLEIKHSE